MLFIRVLISYKVGSARLATYFVQYIRYYILLAEIWIGRLTLQKPRTCLYISEHAWQKREAEVQDALDKGDELYKFFLVGVTKQVGRHVDKGSCPIKRSMQGTTETRERKEAPLEFKSKGTDAHAMSKPFVWWQLPEQLDGVYFHYNMECTC